MKPAELTTAATFRINRPSADDLARARQVLADERASVADLPAPVVETFRSLLEHFERGEDVVLDVGLSYLTVAEAARAMGVAQADVVEMVASHRLAAEQHDGDLRITSVTVAHWLAAENALDGMRTAGYAGQSILE